jgi:hypothetical protein
MLKQSAIIALLCIATSCRHGNGPAGKTTTDSTANKVKTETATTGADTAAGSPDAAGQAGPEAMEHLPPAVASAVPKGYTTLYVVSGDLNLDQYADMIVVLNKEGEDTTSDVVDHPEKRPLLIFTGGANNTYTLAARNDNAVYCVNCGGVMGDPFMQVVIKKGYFSVEHYGGSAWRWTRTITFKYLPADKYWYLHKDGGDSFHAADPDKVTTKVRTTKDFGKVPFDKFDIYKED